MQRDELRFVRRRHEYGDVYTLVFERLGPVRFEAGQYGFMAIGEPGDEMVRELSFASAPDDDEVWFAVHLRSGSDFKQRLAALRPGDGVRVYGIRGRMVAPADGGRPVVMVAQGIGVAPMRSLLRQWPAWAGTRLIQVAREGWLYDTELARLADWRPVRRTEAGGLLKATVLEQRGGCLFYISGSPVFVAEVAERVQAWGVAFDDVRSMMFDRYDDL